MSNKSTIETLVSHFKKIYYIILIVALAVVGKIIAIQFFSETTITSEDIYDIEILPAQRGSILATDGRPLAISLPSYQIRMDCTAPHDTVWNKELRPLANSLSSLYKNKSSDSYLKELKEARKKQKKYYRIGNRNISYIELKQLKEFPIFRYGKFKGGLIVEERNKRENPYGSLASRTIGFINEVGEGAGIEKSLNYKLEGKKGKQYIMRQIGGTYTRVPGKDVTHPKDGLDIRTTIDIDIQECAEKALRSQLTKSDLLEGGTALVMEVSTGAIRAIVNMKKLPNGGYDERYNYAIGQATEPGSTLKLASLIALIEDGYATLNTPIDGGNGEWFYNKVRFSDTRHGGYGMLTLKEAFAKSSNVCFAKLAVEHYGKSKEDEMAFVSRLTNMKIGEKLDLEISGEGYSTIYTPNDTKVWSKVSLPMMSIGYGFLLTPLHTLTFYNSIANGGKVMKPYFIESTEQNGSIVESFKPQVISGSICSKSTIEEAKKALRYVVEKGTASKYDDTRYEICGKTGTAQIATDGKYVDPQGYRRHQASFAGFFPYDSPKYSCIVVLYSAKTRENFYGGTWATPVFKEISDHIYTTHPEWAKPYKGRGAKPEDNPSIAGGKASDIKTILSTIPTKSEIKLPKEGWINIKCDDDRAVSEKMVISSNITPNVIGLGLKDAIYILENEGYRVTFKGRGRVYKQEPSPGDTIKKGEQTTIYLKER